MLTVPLLLSFYFKHSISLLKDFVFFYMMSFKSIFFKVTLVTDSSEEPMEGAASTFAASY